MLADDSLWPTLALTGWTLFAHLLHNSKQDSDADAGNAEKLTEQIVAGVVGDSGEDLAPVVWRACQVVDIVAPDSIPLLISRIVEQQAHRYQASFPQEDGETEKSEFDVVVSSLPSRLEFVMTKTVCPLVKALPSEWSVPRAVYAGVMRRIEREVLSVLSSAKELPPLLRMWRRVLKFEEALEYRLQEWRSADSVVWWDPGIDDDDSERVPVLSSVLECHPIFEELEMAAARVLDRAVEEETWEGLAAPMYLLQSSEAMVWYTQGRMREWDVIGDEQPGMQRRVIAVWRRNWVGYAMLLLGKLQSCPLPLPSVPLGPALRRTCVVVNSANHWARLMDSVLEWAPGIGAQFLDPSRSAFEIVKAAGVEWVARVAGRAALGSVLQVLRIARCGDIEEWAATVQDACAESLAMILETFTEIVDGGSGVYELYSSFVSIVISKLHAVLLQNESHWWQPQRRRGRGGSVDAADEDEQRNAQSESVLLRLLQAIGQLGEVLRDLPSTCSAQVPPPSTYHLHIERELAQIQNLFVMLQIPESTVVEQYTRLSSNPSSAGLSRLLSLRGFSEGETAAAVSEFKAFQSVVEAPAALPPLQATFPVDCGSYRAEKLPNNTFRIASSSKPLVLNFKRGSQFQSVWTLLESVHEPIAGGLRG
eukprot:NODE_595_length_2068_cov_29.466568_g549_i0.p1 GENE.NODE_595_length_2068_cov_29.466568_g549_i0~~NODE_595_length_2068_cov_29.466568_g549_i0.p1  ORF type:complete len:667 (+),score=149.54 NODE_595_length_2068_cov_29.466568_g549_i0:54-2003(+)